METQISVRGEARRSIPPGSPIDDPAAWAEVRADAINAAMNKARDYASALGGSITSIEHLAEPGLLNGGDHGVTTTSSGSGRAGYEAGPRDLYAVVEMRCRATIGPVSEQSRRWIDPGQIRPTVASPPQAEPTEHGSEPPRRPRPARY